VFPFEFNRESAGERVHVRRPAVPGRTRQGGDLRTNGRDQLRETALFVLRGSTLTDHDVEVRSLFVSEWDLQFMKGRGYRGVTIDTVQR